MTSIAERQKAYLQAATSTSKSRAPDRPPPPARVRASTTRPDLSSARPVSATTHDPTSKAFGKHLENRQPSDGNVNGVNTGHKKSPERQSTFKKDESTANGKRDASPPAVRISTSRRGGNIQFSKDGKIEEKMASSEEEPVVVTWNEEDKTSFQQMASPWAKKPSSRGKGASPQLSSEAFPSIHKNSVFGEVSSPTPEVSSSVSGK